jgi:DNA-binding SARP family transcriptional activator
VQVERGERLLRESQLGGPQGRFVLAYLVSERKRAVTQAELAEALWPEGVPASWTLALSAIVSRLRARLATLGLIRSHIIGNAFGCYQFSPPTDTWVDVEGALEGVDVAEGAIVAGNPQGAFGGSLVATIILRRPFLPGDDRPWAESRRATLAAVLIRALDCRVDALASHGELKLALTRAQEVVRLEPYRESSYRRLMRLHVQNGDRAEAIRVYLECKRLLELELGVAPSAETETLYRELAD